MVYDYKAGKQRIKDILNNKLEVKKVDEIPSDANFTFDNAYYGWVTAIFVDIRDSSTLFSKEDKVMVSKIIRSFTSEIIEVLRDYNVHREIGIRGDCVYAIYPTPTKRDVYDIADRAFFINTLFRMINKLLASKGFTQISAGIGIASAQELVIKAGRKDVGINSKVWIGDAVTQASNLSSLGNKDYISPIVMSSVTYDNIIEKMEGENKEARSWFNRVSGLGQDTYYHGSIIKLDFDKWIKDGMKE